MCLLRRTLDVCVLKLIMVSIAVIDGINKTEEKERKKKKVIFCDRNMFTHTLVDAYIARCVPYLTLTLINKTRLFVYYL